jgi:type II secretory ATPase GspE/PulE/Tfp pilus assembly ATPase PilB-like protein
MTQALQTPAPASAALDEQAQAHPQKLDGPNVYGMVPEAAVATLIDHAVALPASDLYLGANENHVSVSVRHLGIVRLLTILSPELGKRCISYIKAMAGMDLAETRRPLDGRWVRQADGASRVDIRISSIPTLHGEDLTLRLLVCQNEAQGLDHLGMSPRNLSDLHWMLSSPSGLILVTGPTGSGKTTTLYACLRHLNDGERKINTIEDPIEYAVSGLRQSQVNLKAEVGFPELLRSILRQTPDIIMIGEIRDPVTAETAVHAASSGQLVLATLHAPIAAAAVQTMLSLGVHPHFLSSSILGVVAQRLVRALCPHCKERIDLGDIPQMFDEVRPWLTDGEGQALYAAKGCPRCHQTGYASRTGVFEVLRINRELRRLIAEGQPTRALRQAAVEDGLVELKKSAMLKVARGETSAEEILRAIPSEYLDIEE